LVRGVGAGIRTTSIRDGTAVKVTAALRLYILGVILLVSLTLCSHNFSRRGETSFLVPLCTAGVAYLLAVRELSATPKSWMHVVIFGLILSAVCHIEFLRQPPGEDDDIHRYIWDGRLQRLGYNPYLLVPNDPALAGLHTAETRTLNHPDLASPYPAGAQ